MITEAQGVRLSNPATYYRIPFPRSSWKVSPSFWSDFRSSDENGDAYCLALHALMMVLSRYCDRDDTVEVLIEQLFDECFCFDGYVIWVISSDPRFSLDRMFDLMLDRNKRDILDDHKKASTGWPTKKKKNDIQSRIREITSPFELFSLMLSPWVRVGSSVGEREISRVLRASSVGLMNSNEDDSRRNFAVSPDKLFSVTDSFSSPMLALEGVHPLQMKLNTYFDRSGERNDAASFYNRFPFPCAVWRAELCLWNYRVLKGAPLPHFISEAVVRRPMGIRAAECCGVIPLSPGGSSMNAKTLDQRIRLLSEWTKAHTCSSAVSAIEVIAAENNETIELRLRIKREKEILQAILDRMPENMAEASYDRAMASFRPRVIKEFFYIFFHSNKVTDVIKAMRNWWNTECSDQKSQWVEINQSTSKLTPFGNYVVRFNETMNKVFRLKSHFNVAHVMFLSALTATHYDW